MLSTRSYFYIEWFGKIDAVYYHHNVVNVDIKRNLIEGAGRVRATINTTARNEYNDIF